MIIDKDDAAASLYKAAQQALSLSSALLRLGADKAVAQNLPPALADTIPHLPALAEKQSFAVVCSNFSCQPPVFEANELKRVLGSQKRPAA